MKFTASTGVRYYDFSVNFGVACDF